MSPCEGLATLEQSDGGSDDLAKVPPGAFKGYPTDRDVPMKSFATWIKGKRIDDDIGPYWRVHNKLYDLTDFVNQHPGGKDWLDITKGTDITESFESSHLSSAPKRLLPKYYVKDINTPRNSPYTFHEDGFYKTLRRKVLPILQEIGKGPSQAMLLLQDGLIISFAALVYATCLVHSYSLTILSGIVLGLSTGCAHNFIHQKDNFRMYYLDLSFFSSYEWRVTHIISHHSYPNTFYDYEVSAFEPFWVFLPKPDKSFLQRYGAIFYEWFIIPFAMHFELLKRVLLWISGKARPRPENFLPFVELVLMAVLAPSIRAGIGLWIVMHCSCGTWMIFSSLAGSHHHPDIYHQGDTPREHPDWGLCQLDAVRDKVGVVGNLFLVATTFGDHGLHHLFPTVDHSKLNELYPIFFQTCREFNTSYNFLTQWETLYGKYVQLASKTPNPSPPGSKRRSCEAK